MLEDELRTQILPFLSLVFIFQPATVDFLTVTPLSGKGSKATFILRPDNPGMIFLWVLFGSQLACPHQEEAIALFFQCHLCRD